MLTSAKPGDLSPSFQAVLHGKQSAAHPALALPAGKELVAALRTIQRELTLRPDYPGIQSALQMVEAKLRVYPDCMDFLTLRALLLDNLGRDREATEAYQVVLRRDPAHRIALVNFGNRLNVAGKKAEALKIYMLAVIHHADDPMCHVNLANMFLKLGKTENARLHFEYALKLDPRYRQAHMGLSLVLPRLGDPEMGTLHRAASFKGQCILSLPFRGEQRPVTVLLLVSVTGLCVRFRDYLSDHIFKIHMVATQFYDPRIALPPHDLVLNALGDVDSDPVALDGAKCLLRHTTAAVINQPDAVLTTGRCDISRRLAGIPGVVTAKTITLTRDELESDNLNARLESEGLKYPLLLRTPGCHGGDNFLKADSSNDLPAAIAALPGETLFVMQYLDARGSDGQMRKYRVMMVDGQLYPLHLAIADHWKIHYFSADMADNARNRAEEAEFLNDMEAALGATAMSALKQIQATLGLDYGGIDFGLNGRGEVLVFETNATMAVIRPDGDSRWDYRRPAIDRIYQAVSAMLLERSRKPTHPLLKLR